jgi:hypothetical protein
MVLGNLLDTIKVHKYYKNFEKCNKKTFLRYNGLLRGSCFTLCIENITLYVIIFK